MNDMIIITGQENTGIKYLDVKSMLVVRKIAEKVDRDERNVKQVSQINCAFSDIFTFQFLTNK